MPTISTPASSQPKNSCWAFPCWKRVRTLYVDTFKGLKVDRRRFSGPTVRDVVPLARQIPPLLLVLQKYKWVLFISIIDAPYTPIIP